MRQEARKATPASANSGQWHHLQLGENTEQPEMAPHSQLQGTRRLTTEA